MEVNAIRTRRRIQHGEADAADEIAVSLGKLHGSLTSVSKPEVLTRVASR